MPRIRKLIMQIGGQNFGTGTLPCSGMFPPGGGLNGVLTVVLGWTPPEVAAAATPACTLSIFRQAWGTDPEFLQEKFTPNAATDVNVGDPNPAEDVATVFNLLGVNKYTQYVFPFDVTCSKQCVELLRDQAGTISADGSNRATFYPFLDVAGTGRKGSDRVAIECDDAIATPTFSATLEIPKDAEDGFVVNDGLTDAARYNIMTEIDERIASTVVGAFESGFSDIAGALLRRRDFDISDINPRPNANV